MRLPSSSRRRRKARLLGPLLVLSVAATLPGVAAAHEFDHPPDGFTTGFPDPSADAQSGGRDGAEYEVLTTIPTGNPHTDLDFFTKGGETYASVGTLGAGLNDGGQSLIKLTEGGEVETEDGPAAQFVGAHPSADCVTDESAALGLQHDVEATPKAPDLITGDSYLPTVPAKTGDAQLLIDATDASGRCHDQGTFGVRGVTDGGLEIIDVSTLGPEGLQYEEGRTTEIALTSHIGEAHTVNVDPKRPHIAYAVTSDSVTVQRDDKDNDDPSDDTFRRTNEDRTRPNPNTGITEPNPGRFALDGFEVVDMSSCMTAPYGRMAEGLSIDEKRAACKPEVYRYRYPTVEMALGHTLKGLVYGCHELQMYPDDLLTCGSGAAAMLFDVGGAFEPQADGIDKPKGTPLPCHVRETSTTGPTPTGALITDCVNGGQDCSQSLAIPDWIELGSPSLTGVEHLGSIHHAGRATATGFATTRPSTEDIDFNHEMEFTHSRRFVLSTDERGGGVLGGSQCSQANSTPEFANGGINAQKVSTLLANPANTVEATDASYALDAAGEEKSIYRAPIRTGVEGAFCTAHVMQQIPGQNRIVMGWYSQGTQVVDYVELPGEKLQFVETAFGIPVNANQWVSHVFSVEQDEEGRFVYYGATGDTVGGRNGIDVFKLTLPAPLTACDLKAGTAERSEPSTVTDRDKARGVHVENVDCVLNYGISKGKTVDAQGNPVTYAPTEQVTRGQMASFIANALVASRDDEGVLPAAGADQFSDIGTNTHRAAINRLAQAGIVRGLTGPGGRFAPEQLITRDQMASFITSAARFAAGGGFEPTRTDYFGDVPAGNVHERNISAGFENGLFQGTVAPGAAPRSGQFQPGVQVQRDQMATFLVNLFTKSIR